MPTMKGLQISVLTLLLLCKIAGGFSPNSLIQQKNIAVSKPSTALFSQVDDEAEEKVWRYVKKPLLSIGSKGASLSHGNSLRQLLEDHTAVKVKVNTKAFDSLQNAAEILRDLAIEKGAPKDIEMIQMRDKDRTILFGSPGWLEQVKAGTFPPPPPPPREEDDDDEAEDE